jgi:hypothetical protein
MWTRNCSRCWGFISASCLEPVASEAMAWISVNVVAQSFALVSLEADHKLPARLSTRRAYPNGNCSMRQGEPVITCLPAEQLALATYQYRSVTRDSMTGNLPAGDDSMRF